MIDQGVSTAQASSGSVQVNDVQGKTYYLYVITQTGGVARSADTSVPILNAPSLVMVLAGYNPPFNRGAFTISREGGGVLSWNAATSSNDLITIETASGQTQSKAAISFSIHTSGLSIGHYSAYVQIDAGEAGSQNVTLEIFLADPIVSVYLPAIKR